MADSVKLTTSNQTHNSDSISFSIAPGEALPPPPPNGNGEGDIIEWWNNLPWWQKALIATTAIVGLYGAAAYGSRQK